MKVALFFLIMVTTFSVVASAGDCTPVDIRKNQGLGPVRNQGTRAWCFAMTAADLLGSAHQMEASPLALLIQTNYQRYFLTSKNNSYDPNVLLSTEGADLARSINNLAAIGYCPQYRYPKERELGYLDNTKLLKMLSSDHESLYTVMNTVRYCGGSSQAFPFVATTTMTSKMQKSEAERSLSEAVSRELGKNRGLALLLNVDVFDQAKNGRSLRSGLHAALVVARRKNDLTQTCEYRLRNSWGPIDSENKLEYPYFDKGHLVLSEQQLLGSLTGYIHLVEMKTKEERIKYLELNQYPYLK